MALQFSNIAFQKYNRLYEANIYHPNGQYGQNNHDYSAFCYFAHTHCFVF